jgi:hypothetical protein
MTPPQIPPVLKHYLCVGCWSGEGSRDERFAVHKLAGAVLRGQVEGLRRAWADVGPFLKAAHSAPTFCEEMLAGRLHRINTETWPKHFGRTRCPEHPVGGQRNAPR